MWMNQTHELSAKEKNGIYEAIQASLLATAKMLDYVKGKCNLKMENSLFNIYYRFTLSYFSSNVGVLECNHEAKYGFTVLSSFIYVFIYLVHMLIVLHWCILLSLVTWLWLKLVLRLGTENYVLSKCCWYLTLIFSSSVKKIILFYVSFSLTLSIFFGWFWGNASVLCHL